MKTTVIDVTGLSDKQIALVEEIVTALRSVPDNQQINCTIIKQGSITKVRRYLMLILKASQTQVQM